MNVAKNTMKGKMGMMELSKEDSGVIDETKVVAENKEQLKSVQKCLGKAIVAHDRVVVENKALGQALCHMGEISQERDEHNGLEYGLGGLLSATARVVMELQGLAEQSAERREGQLQAAVRELLEDEVRDALEAKKHYDRVKINYDVATSNLKSLQAKSNSKAEKVTEAEKAKRARWEDLVTTGFSTHETMETCNDRTEWSMIEAVAAYVAEQENYFRQALTLAQTLSADVARAKEAVAVLQVKSGEKAKARVAERKLLQQKIHSGPEVQSKSQVFGVDLATLCEREAAADVPALVETCASWIEAHALTVDGIFRLSGTNSDINVLRDACNRSGAPPALTPTSEAHVVSGLLKLFLRELPEPVIPFSLFDDFIAAADAHPGDDAAQLADLRRVLSLLPPRNRALFDRLMRTSVLVAQHEPENRMTCGNMARVIAPSIIWAPQINPETLVHETQAANQLIELYIVSESGAPSSRASMPTPPRRQTYANEPPPQPRAASWTHAEPDIPLPSEPPTATSATPTPPSSPAPSKVPTKRRSVVLRRAEIAKGLSSQGSLPHIPPSDT